MDNTESPFSSRALSFTSTYVNSPDFAGTFKNFILDPLDSSDISELVKILGLGRTKDSSVWTEMKSGVLFFAVFGDPQLDPLGQGQVLVRSSSKFEKRNPRE